jgi:hypothetical protein
MRGLVDRPNAENDIHVRLVGSRQVDHHVAGLDQTPLILLALAL